MPWAIGYFVAGAMFFVLGAMQGEQPDGSNASRWLYLLGGVFCASGFITSLRHRKASAQAGAATDPGNRSEPR